MFCKFRKLWNVLESIDVVEEKNSESFRFINPYDLNELNKQMDSKNARNELTSKMFDHFLND